MFRPFVGEVITGRIMAATHHGIRLSLEFFDDIFVPAHLMFDTASLYCSFFIVILTLVIMLPNLGNFQCLKRNSTI